VARDGRLILVRNPYFREWSEAAQPAGYPDRIEVPPTPPRQTKANGAATAPAPQRRRLHSGGSMGSPLRPKQKSLARVASQFHDAPTAQTVYLALNTRSRPFNDVRVRRALNYALNRATMIKATNQDLTEWAPTCQILPPNFPGYRRYCPYTRNPSAGRW